jgi:hypothetical protein
MYSMPRFISIKFKNESRISYSLLRLGETEGFQLIIVIDPSTKPVVHHTRRVSFHLQQPLERCTMELLGKISYRTSSAAQNLVVQQSPSTQETQGLETGVGYVGCQFSNTQRALPNINNRSGAV